MKTLDQDYAEAGFGGRLGFGRKPALLLIDFCRAYIDPACSLYAGVEASQAAGATLLEAARAAGVPAIFTTVSFAKGGADGGVFYRKVKALKTFARGENPAFQAFAEGLEPREDEVVVTKQYASAFFGTSLAATLAAQGIDTVLLSGWSTSGCVRASAVDCIQHGFVPVVVREAVGDRDPRVHEANLFDIGAKYGDVVGLDETLAYLEGLGGRG